MTTERKTDHSLGFGGELEQALAKGDRHNTVLLPMQHKKRRVQADNTLIGAKRVLHQPAYGHERISRGADIDRGCEGRVENKSADLALGRKRGGDSGAERFAPHHDAFWGVACGRKLVGSIRIAKIRLRLACRWTHHSRDKDNAESSGAVLDQPFEAAGTHGEPSGVALKINHHPLFPFRRHARQPAFLHQHWSKSPLRPAAGRPRPAAFAWYRGNTSASVGRRTSAPATRHSQAQR